MKARFHTSLLPLVALFAFACVAARAQDAAQSPAQTKPQPSAAAKRRTAAKKTAARKKTADEASAPDASSQKSSSDADAGQSPASTDAKPSQTPAASAEATKSESDRSNKKDEATKNKSEAEKSDAASQSKTDAATQDKPDAATTAKTDASSKSSKAQAAKGQKKAAAEDQPARQFDPAKAAELKSKLEEIQKLAAWERIPELRDFLDLDLPDDLADAALERLISSEAAYGDERLKAGDAARGVALFRDAVADADEDISDDLYYKVVSQLPANLLLRGQPAAAFDLAHRVEKIAQGSARRLLAVAAFYVSVEQPDDAARLASAALKLRPDMAAAHEALAAAQRLSLKLDDSLAEYARAAELDPKSADARASLADMKRATGKPEEALAIYRDLLAADPQNHAARDGVVLALFDTGKREEAEHELEAALKDDPKDVQLLAGAAYWYAGHGDSKRAAELAGQVVQLAPHQPWGQVALSRAFIANGLPFEAERAMRFLRNFADFPTLDYELANALAAEGFYAEAAEELSRSFSIKGDQIETRLAGRTPAAASNFVELLAPERRASLFEPDAADTPENARQLKGLLALHTALRLTDTDEQRAAAEAPAAQAARDFASGDDPARAFRQLYAATRLLRRNVADDAALELTNAARRAVADAVATPQATAAVTADELRKTRADALEQGVTPDVPDVPRGVLDRLMRGRIEELTGWALFNQGRAREAVAPLRQAVGVMPENSLYWREALWRLGNAYLASGERQQALDSYVKSFDQENPDEARFAVIQTLYRNLHGGTTDGLEVLFGLAPERAADPTAPAGTTPAQTSKPALPWAAGTTDSSANNDQPASSDAPKPEAKDDSAKPVTKDAGPKNEAPKSGETKSDETKSDGAKNVETKNAETKNVEKESGETKSAAPAQPPASSDASAASAASPAPSPESAPAQSSGDQTPAPESAAPHKRVKDTFKRTPAQTAADCSITLDSETLPLKAGASVTFTVSLEGGGDPSKINATTPDWSDIIILREPSGADANAVKFTVTSISKSTGDYAITVKSPCGSKKITVSVK